MLYSIVSKLGTFAERIFLIYLISISNSNVAIDVVNFELSVYIYILGSIIVFRYGETFIISVVNLIKFMMATPRKD